MLLLSTKISMIFNLSQMTTSQIMFISQAVLQCINKKEENPLFTLNINAQSNSQSLWTDVHRVLCCVIVIFDLLLLRCFCAVQSLSVNDVLFVCAVYFSTTNEFVELPVLVQLSNSYNNIQPSGNLIKFSLYTSTYIAFVYIALYTPCSIESNL